MPWQFKISRNLFQTEWFKIRLNSGFHFIKNKHRFNSKSFRPTCSPYFRDNKWNGPILNGSFGLGSRATYQDAQLFICHKRYNLVVPPGVCFFFPFLRRVPTSPPSPAHSLYLNGRRRRNERSQHDHHNSLPLATLYFAPPSCVVAVAVEMRTPQRPYRVRPPNTIYSCSGRWRRSFDGLCVEWIQSFDRWYKSKTHSPHWAHSSIRFYRNTQERESVCLVSKHTESSGFSWNSVFFEWLPIRLTKGNTFAEAADVVENSQFDLCFHRKILTNENSQTEQRFSENSKAFIGNHT